ncbi:elongation of very long chain fatty acids protein F-like [Episyrphus balteatus]|uniref:elongation of very long chain fatty acids protein F-like n=1 Tax=Episyrphus balteatus TaxID=286459 RepID=UPI00248535A6|nr:elongation of very long chain fatty acids protein F-like [Episyrphus balteatus]
MELRLTDQDVIETITNYNQLRIGFWSSSVIVASYLLAVLKIAPSYMKSRPAFHLKTFIVFYNIFQIITCAYLIFKSFTINLPVTHFWKCVVVTPGSTEDKDYHHVAFVLFCLKVSEFTETLVFVLRKKYRQVSFLHVFHHCSTVFMAYHMNHSYSNSAAFFPLYINSFVHLIMYTYYLMAATLPSEVIKKLIPLKKSITIIQMVQFTIVLAQVVIALCLGCKFPNGLLALYCFMIMVIFYEFYNFYQKSYIKKQAEKSKIEEDKLNNNYSIKSQ